MMHTLLKYDSGEFGPLFLGNVSTVIFTENNIKDDKI